MHQSNIKLFIFVLISLCAVQDVFSNPQNASRKPKADQSNKQQQDCANHLQMIDKCSSETTYSYIASFTPYPTNANELKVSCQTIPDSLKCLRNYAKCMGSLGKRIVVAYALSRSKHSKKICASISDPKSIEFYKSNECIKNSTKVPALATFEKEFGSSFQYLAKNKTMSFDSRFHMACCEASNYKLKLLAGISSECNRFIGAQEDYTDSTVGDLLDLVCPDSKRLSEICPKLAKLPKSREWNPMSLNRSALDFIIALAELEDKKEKTKSKNR